MPAGPQSSHPAKTKQDSQKTKQKRKSSQEGKLKAIQMQFMQETLTKLQMEKQNRAAALNKAILRKNSGAFLPDRSVSDLKKSAKQSSNVELKRSKNQSMHESFLS